jgi:tetratricopeptide (TPR) repeat protein
VVLHAASGLRAAAIPASKIVDALTKLRQALPRGGALTALAKGPIESELSSTEQQFVVDHRTPNPMRLKRQQAAELRLQKAEQYFAEALAVEETDIAAARAGYLTALSVHSGHLEARINLGRLLHLNGELAAAEKVYREAKHASALLSFNLAALLEDLDREEEAVLSYREALALDPTLHDAHYNLSRLHEKAERPREALQHLLAYRRFGRLLNEE